MMTECGAVTPVGDNRGAHSTGSAVDGGPGPSGKGGGGLPGIGLAVLPGATAAAGARAGAPARTWSLQREWSWVFVVMFLAVLLGAAATVIGVRGLMNEVHSAASRLHTEADIVAGLRGALDAHEQAGLLLLAGAPADLPAYIQREGFHGPSGRDEHEGRRR
jgi:hypothetical protein